MERTYVSIVCPTTLTSYAVLNTVKSIIDQDPWSKFCEVIIVYNSNDTKQNEQIPILAKSLIDQIHAIDSRIVVAKESGIGLTAARHKGYKISKGEYISYIDDDVVVPKEWLENLILLISTKKFDLFGGPSLPIFSKAAPEWISILYESTPYGGWMCDWFSINDLETTVPNVNPDFIWGLNFTIRATLINELGGFNPDLVPSIYQMWQGDGETGLTRKLAENEFSALYDQKLKVFHSIPEERLDIDYLISRTRYKGFAESFKYIRNKEQITRSTIVLNLLLVISRLVNIILSKLTIILIVSNNIIIKKLFKLVFKSFLKLKIIEYFIYHMIQVKINPTLIDWIKQESFLDVFVPIESDR